MANMIFNKAMLNIVNNVVDLDSDVIKCCLTTGDPVATWENLAHVTNQLAAGNGYTAGGVVVACTTSEAAGVTTFTSANPVWDPITFSTATHAIWYSDTSTDKKLICAKTFGGAKIVEDNEFQIKVNAAGLFTIP